MFERFTDRARRVVVLAQEHARMLNHNRIGTEHLLLGLLHEGEGVAATALDSLGIDRAYVEQRVVETIGRGAEAPSGHIPFTPAAKKALERSLREALGLGHNYIGTEHLLLGLIFFADDPAVTQIILPRVERLSDVRQRVVLVLFGYGGPAGKPFRDLTALAAAPGGLGPVVGRQQEVNDVIAVLQREPTANALLVGERGVGVSTVVCGVAQALIRPDAPARLAGKRIRELSLPLSPAFGSTQVAAELLPTLLDDVRRTPDTILFVEHSCTPIPSQSQPTTLLELLRPMIIGRELQAIATVTPAEQREYLAADTEFSQVFDPILIGELSEELAAVVLAELRDRYESRHQVAVTDAAITAAVVLSVQHEPDEPLPGKAIALIDKAAALAAHRIITDEQFVPIRRRIEELRAGKDAAIDDRDYLRAAALREEEKRQLKVLHDRQAAWRAEWKNVPDHRIISVTAEDVASVLTQERTPAADRWEGRWEGMRRV
jgi:ATP-dependent Clp protease ATP-binding subunit ClpC